MERKGHFRVIPAILDAGFELLIWITLLLASTLLLVTPFTSAPNATKADLLVLFFIIVLATIIALVLLHRYRRTRATKTGDLVRIALDRFGIKPQPMSFALVGAFFLFGSDFIMWLWLQNVALLEPTIADNVLALFAFVLMAAGFRLILHGWTQSPDSGRVRVLSWLALLLWATLLGAAIFEPSNYLSTTATILASLILAFAVSAILYREEGGPRRD